MPRYKLRATIHGHDQDVRCVVPAPYPAGAILSASRDRTAKVWSLDMDSHFIEGLVMGGHENFVSCVCAVPADSAEHPHGLVATGCNDRRIRLFSLDSPVPLYTLEGHEAPVSCLTAGRSGTLLSGSWDNTARVWLGRKCLLTLRGHEAALWGVTFLPEKGLMVTASADKTLKVWKAGVLTNTLKGHTDCVRAVVALNHAELISSSNDMTIRHWVVESGQCIHVYFGHTSFVYGLAVIPRGANPEADTAEFVSSGEDRTVRVWSGGQCTQVLTLPAQSVWSVCALANGDLACACNDGAIRVFSRDPARHASDAVQAEFDEQVASFTVSAKTTPAGDLGNIKVDDLPAEESLQRPGTKEGQTTMVRCEDGHVDAYMWTLEGGGRWDKIGQVVGSNDSTQPGVGKTTYEGKEYDYVFSVDVQEGAPPLKLPYNLNEDPWHAAQRFIHKNNLSQLFLDQVANFIVENSKGVTLTQGAPADYQDPYTGVTRYTPYSSPGGDSGPGNPGALVEYADPFTGSGRYIPGPAVPQRAPDPPSAAAPQPGSGLQGDPFTGAGRYVPGTQNGTAETALPRSEYFPLRVMLNFEAAGKPAAIVAKLREFLSSAPPADGAAALSEAEVDLVAKVIDPAQPESTDPSKVTEAAATLGLILDQWPRDKVFPALDCVRILTRRPQAVEVVLRPGGLLETACRVGLDAAGGEDGSSSQGLQVNASLALRALCNAFSDPRGFAYTEDKRERLVERCVEAVGRPGRTKALEVAAASLLVNYAVALGRGGGGGMEAEAQVLGAAVTLLKIRPDLEAAFRLLVCIGTVISADAGMVAVADSLGLRSSVESLSTTKEPEKVGKCAQQLLRLLPA